MTCTLEKFLSISSCTGCRYPWSAFLFALPLREIVKCRLCSLYVFNVQYKQLLSTIVATVSRSFAMLRIRLWIAYCYTSTPGVKRGTMRNELWWGLVETEHPGICSGIVLVRDQCSRLLHKNTREPSSSADDDRTVSVSYTHLTLPTIYSV